MRFGIGKHLYLQPTLSHCLIQSIVKLNYYRKMEELVKKVKAEFDAFVTDATLQLEKGNKAAGTRARKSSLELEKMLKEFRKVSLEESKK